jgi:hypothetical protein
MISLFRPAKLQNKNPVETVFAAAKVAIQTDMAITVKGDRNEE